MKKPAGGVTGLKESDNFFTFIEYKCRHEWANGIKIVLCKWWGWGFEWQGERRSIKLLPYRK